MSVNIDNKLIEDMSVLAKIKLSEEEIEDTKKELRKIVEYVDTLMEVNTDNIEPMCQIISERNVYREDVITNKDETEKILLNAPEKDGANIVVPNTFE